MRMGNAINASTGKKNNKSPTSSASRAAKSVQHDPNDLPTPRQFLFPPSKLNRMLTWPEVRPIGAGLHNLGNTCFMNSVLQAIIYTPPVAHFAMESDHSKTCRDPGFCPLCYLSTLIKQSLTHTQRAIAPKGFFHNLRALNRGFRPGRQEDAHEFLRCLIDSLHKANVPNHKKLDPYVAQTAFFMQTHGGYLQSQIKCSSCGYESNTFDPFLDLSLEINKSKHVIQALRHFTTAEILDGDNKYRCSGCKKLVRASKQFTIKQAPNILCLHFKRFAFGRGKLNHHVEFPPTLSMQPYMSKGSSASDKYELYAVVVHLGGSMHAGHYYAFVKNSNGMWYHMDDSSVNQVGLKSVLKSHAYMCFYRRISVQNKEKERRMSTERPHPKADPRRGSVETAHAMNGVTMDAYINGDRSPKESRGKQIATARASHDGTGPGGDGEPRAANGMGSQVVEPNGVGLWIVQNTADSDWKDILGLDNNPFKKKRRRSSQSGEGAGAAVATVAAACTGSTVGKPRVVETVSAAPIHHATPTVTTGDRPRRTSLSEEVQQRVRRDSVEAINGIFEKTEAEKKKKKRKEEKALRKAEKRRLKAEGKSGVKKTGAQAFDPKTYTQGRREMLGKRVDAWGAGEGDDPEALDTAIAAQVAARDGILRSREMQVGGGGKKASKWDEFYDQGKVKKVKKPKLSHQAATGVNPFTAREKDKVVKQLKRKGFQS
eukprot:TRINITY_DN954_c0_g1_i1.p1 TRINITY_DN954_c0_g1~~TRINITY_DN954_c0_g1_i1.p1  ORF type:complete len:713 (+),score=143.23 TRINITY_DN954_c0_g1_i1:596-2734(+)